MASVEIRVTFEHEGILYKGFFTQPFGIRGNIWFLTVNKRHWEQLMYYPHGDVRRHHSNDNSLKDLAEYFGTVIMAWYE